MEQKSSQVLAVDYITFIRYAPLIYTDEIGEYLMRYKMLRKYNIKSYGDVLDDLPAVWVDVLDLIDTEAEKAMKCKNDN